MDKTKKPIVLVVSRSYIAGLSVVRSLAAEGYTVDLISSTGMKGNTDLIASCKYIRNFTKVASRRNMAEEELVEAVLSSAEGYKGKAILIPTDTFTAKAVDNARVILEPYYIIPTMIDAGIGEYSSAGVQRAKARECGLPMASEWMIDGRDTPNINTLPEDIIYPCVCQPDDSGSLKSVKAVCGDPYELLEHIGYLRRRLPGCDIVIREYYEADNVINMTGVVRGNEIYCPAYLKSTDVAQYRSKNTLMGELHDIEDLGELKNKIYDFVRSFSYTGAFNLTLRIDEDKLYFDKLRFNCGRQGWVYFKSGVNLFEILVKALQGKEFIPAKTELKVGTTFINDKSAWEDYIRGYINKKELEAALKSVDVSLIADDRDPAPGNVFRKMMKRTAIRSSIKRFIKKNFFPTLRRIKYGLLGYPQSKKKNERDPLAPKPRVLVAGRNYCSNLCLARAFGQAGYDVEVLRIFQVRPNKKNLLRFLKPDAYSKYVKAYHVCLSKKKSSRIIKKLISIADLDRKMLLVPADDLVANTVDEYLAKLLDYYIIPNVNEMPDEINRLMGKDIQKDMAEAAGLPVINSCVIKSVQGEFDIPDEVNYPCFIKPNISKNGLKSRMRRCDSEEELREVLTEYASKSDFEMMVQDYIEIGREFSILGVSTKNGVIGPGFFGAEEGGHDSRRGVALTGEVVPVARNQKLIDDTIKFIETMNYEGLYDIDLIETVDGKMYFVEMNMRYGGSGYAIVASGCNLPGMFADYMLMHKPLDMNAQVPQTGKHFISEKIMIEEYASGYLSFKELKEHMKKADIHFIQDKEDKRPYRHFRRYYIMAAIMKFSSWMQARREENE